MHLQVIVLDDIGENLKPAREMGMATVLVRDTDTVLKELEQLSGVQVRCAVWVPLSPALPGSLERWVGWTPRAAMLLCKWCLCPGLWVWFVFFFLHFNYTVTSSLSSDAGKVFSVEVGKNQRKRQRKSCWSSCTERPCEHRQKHTNVST